MFSTCHMFLRSKGLPKKALLLIDNAPCHPKNNELKSDDGNFVIMCLPPNCTALLQPLDQNAINLTKIYYKKNLLTNLIGTKGTDLEKKLKDFNIRMAVTLLANAWDKVSAVAIKKCWNVLMSKNEQWTDEDDLPLSLLRDQIAEEQTSITPSISNLLQDILPDMNFTDSEIGEWIREDYSDESEAIDLSEEEIAENVQIEKTQKVKVDDVIKALDICMEWATENDISYEKLIALQEIKEAAISQKVKKPKTQTKISTFFPSN